MSANSASLQTVHHFCSDHSSTSAPVKGLVITRAASASPAARVAAPSSSPGRTVMPSAVASTTACSSAADHSAMGRASACSERRCQSRWADTMAEVRG